MTLHSLLAEPEPAVRGFLERQLRNDGFDVARVRARGAAAARRGSRRPRPRRRRGARPRRRARLPGDRARRRGSGRRACARSSAPTTAWRGRSSTRSSLARIHALLRRCPPRVELLEVGAARDRPRGAPRHRATGRRSSCRRRSTRCSSSSRPIPTASSPASSCFATSGGSARTSRRGRSSRTPPASGASSPRPGCRGWVVNVWGVGYKLRHVSSG